MNFSKRFWIGTIAALCLVILIMDTKTAISGASEGLSLCLYSIIPALFPFCVLSKLIASSLIGRQMPFLRPIGRLCGIPAGSESILILGFLGGYPVGAQCINDTYRKQAISKKDARRMLGFCSNAGPSFLFGMLGGLFEDSGPLWCILIIHVLSAVIVGCLLPEKSKQTCTLKENKTVSIPTALEESVKTLALICGWVIAFRIILCFLQRWFLWMLNPQLQIAISGILELSNGCISLYTLSGNGLRFILSSGFLSFGGLCVAMQTASVTKSIGKSIYFPGKILQTAISLLLASIVQYPLFAPDQRWSIPIWLPVSCISVILLTSILLHLNKKVVAFAQ